jgi:carboxypeptidase family protein
MKSGGVRWLFVVLALLAVPAAGYAQEAILTGTVTDATGGVLPGVTVTAVHAATGNRFTAVTDERGIFRIPGRIGGYEVIAELQGFTTMTRAGLELLVGQTATINMQMSPSTVQETVTVTAEAPLLEVSTSSLGSNIDSRQMSELPVQGRDWMALALLAPGNRTTTIGQGTPVQDRAGGRDVREFQVNLDGQQVTGQMGPGGQPRFSRDAIAEFQFISNRFDATQGRSSGVLVNAVTKSGTNAYTGMVAGYFRDSDWNSEDPVLHRVLPMQNQQYSTTSGGPIIRDRLHFFAAYEYEREPRTSVANTAWPSFNVELTGTTTTKMGTARLDYQLSPELRLMVKGNASKFAEPFATLGSNHPASTTTTDQNTSTLVAQLTQVLSNRALNQIQMGHSGFGFENRMLSNWSNHWMAPAGITNGHPRITFTGFSIAGNANAPRYQTQDVWMARDDFTFSYDARGRHDLKAGGEFLWDKKVSFNCANCMGIIDARNGTAANIPNLEALFPDPFNVDTWNLAGISQYVRSYTIGVGKHKLPFDQPKVGAWAQDDWHISDRLTLNLGVRYDLLWDPFANWVALEPWMAANRPQDANNIQPRAGFAYTLNDRTVLRGGAGKYYSDIIASNWTHASRSLTVAFIQVNNDGRADFAVNPFNGPLPTHEQALTRFCYANNNAPGCLFRAAEEQAPPPAFAHLTQTWQSSIGFQRQVGTDMAFEVDYVYNRGRDEKMLEGNINLTYNPATGANYTFADRTRRIDPNWGPVGMYAYLGESNLHGLQTAFSKRFSNRWQGSATYTLSSMKDSDPPPLSGLNLVSIPLAEDFGGVYGPSDTDQRHRAVFNGIWQVAYGFQMSGLYFYGSGERTSTSYGGDLRNVSQGGNGRLRPDGTIVPRNNFIRDPIHRVDVRLQQRIPLMGRASMDGMLELFNLFNRVNYGSYVLQESSPQYGQPQSNTNLAYAPRTLQLGFRLSF